MIICCCLPKKGKTRNLPTDLSYIFASDLAHDRMLASIDRWSSRVLTFSSYPFDTCSCSRWTRSLLPALALWSRFRMALANKSWLIFGERVDTRNLRACRNLNLRWDWIKVSCFLWQCSIDAQLTLVCFVDQQFSSRLNMFSTLQ